MSKQTNKDVRAPIAHQEDVNKVSDDEKHRIAYGRVSVLDASYYQRLPEYQGHTLRWFSDRDGTLERAMDLGMQLVPARTDRVRSKALHGDDTCEWERKAVGSEEGHTVYNYLCHMPTDEYEKYFLGPQRKRQQDIDDAMKMGRVSSDSPDAKLPGGGEIGTYAARADSAGFNPVR